MNCCTQEIVNSRTNRLASGVSDSAAPIDREIRFLIFPARCQWQCCPTIDWNSVSYFSRYVGVTVLCHTRQKFSFLFLPLGGSDSSAAVAADRGGGAGLLPRGPGAGQLLRPPVPTRPLPHLVHQQGKDRTVFIFEYFMPSPLLRFLQYS